MSLFAFKCDNGRRMGACPILVRGGLSNIKLLENPSEAQKLARILVVDDEPLMFKAASRALKAKRCEVAGASSGEDALEILRTRIFDVIILDFNMPNMNGLEFFEKLSPEDKAKVLFYSGISGNRDYVAYTGRPFLGKPFENKALCAAVAAIAGPIE